MRISKEIGKAGYPLGKIIKDIQFKEQDLELKRHVEYLNTLIIGFYIEEDKEMIIMAKKNKTQKGALMENNSYEQKIQQEALFWGKIAEEQLDDGVIPDLRRPVKKTKVVGMWDDSKIEKIMRGKFRELLIKKATEVKGRTLDLGCGMGWLSLELARNGMDVDGIDISEKRIQVARRYIEVAPGKGNFGSINYIIADLNKIVFKDNIYESVVVWDALHHIPEIDRLMREVRKALKPGGNFVALDHIGSTRAGRIIHKILYLLLPTDTSYPRKLKLIGERLKRKSCHEQPDSNDRSPFEDVTQKKMIEVIKKNFTVKKMRTTLSFSANLVAVIRLKEPLKYKLITLIKFVDDLFIKAKILRGEYVFIYAKKEEVGDES